jgi:hypothetical protein
MIFLAFKFCLLIPIVLLICNLGCCLPLSSIQAIKDIYKCHYLAVARFRHKPPHFRILRTSYCIFIVIFLTLLLRKALKYFPITNQIEYKIITLSLKTLNNNSSPLFLLIHLCISYSSQSKLSPFPRYTS